jgi:hypothetical protein
MALILDGTNGETFPSWTTGTRPGSPATGQEGYNTTLGYLEVYTGSVWNSVAGSSVGVTSATAQDIGVQTALNLG